MLHRTFSTIASQIIWYNHILFVFWYFYFLIFFKRSFYDTILADKGIIDVRHLFSTNGATEPGLSSKENLV